MPVKQKASNFVWKWEKPVGAPFGRKNEISISDMCQKQKFLYTLGMWNKINWNAVGGLILLSDFYGNKATNILAIPRELLGLFHQQKQHIHM